MDHDWSDDILITKLPAEPQASDKLSAITAKLVLDKPRSDLIVDLGAVDEPSYQTLCRLTTLCSALDDCGCRCILYNLSAATRRVFHLYGFDRIFQIANAEVVLTPSVEQVGSGTLEVRSLNNAKPLERRKYVRLRIPSWVNVNVVFWHGGRNDDYHKLLPGHLWHGRLQDISKGGIQVVIDATQETTLGKGQLVGLEFRPDPGKPMMVFDAQIREILPTADGKNACLGLQFRGVEDNPEGYKALQRFCIC